MIVYYIFLNNITFILLHVISMNISNSDYSFSLNPKAIELCRQSNSLSAIPPDVQERLIALLPFSESQPEELWDAVSHLHLLAIKEANNDLGYRLAQCVRPYLGFLRPNIKLIIANKAQKHFNSLALAQIPYFTSFFTGPMLLNGEAPMDSFYTIYT